MGVPARRDFVLFGIGSHAQSHRDASLVGLKKLDSQGLHLFKGGVDFRVGHVVAESIRHGEEIHTGTVKAFPNILEKARWRAESPLADFFAAFQVFGCDRCRNLAADTAALNARLEKSAAKFDEAYASIHAVLDRLVDCFVSGQGGTTATTRSAGTAAARATGATATTTTPTARATGTCHHIIERTGDGA